MSVLPPSVTLRAATEEDQPFLLRLFASTREPELEAAGMPREQWAPFLGQQFEAQSRHYATYEATSFEVVQVDGEPAGRLIVARWPEELRVVDVSLLPEYRGRGIGGSLLSWLIEEADQRGVKTSIHVERFNPAQRLYARLGFREAADDGSLYLLFERPSAAAGQEKTAS